MSQQRMGGAHPAIAGLVTWIGEKSQWSEAEIDELADAFRHIMRVLYGHATEAPLRDAAATLGHAGGIKGGKARAAALTPERRSEIAREAAEKRWERERTAREETDWRGLPYEEWAKHLETEEGEKGREA